MEQLKVTLHFQRDFVVDTIRLSVGIALFQYDTLTVGLFSFSKKLCRYKFFCLRASCYVLQVFMASQIIQIKTFLGHFSND